MTKVIGCLIQQIKNIKTLICCSSNNRNNLYLNMYAKVGKPKRKFTYSAPYGKGHFSNTELNLTHFYTNPNFLLDIWKYIAELFQKQLEVLKKVLFGEVMREINIRTLRTQYIFTWLNRPIYVHMMSSKVVRTHHHIRRFLSISMVLKIHPNAY